MLLPSLYKWHAAVNSPPRARRAHRKTGVKKRSRIKKEEKPVPLVLCPDRLASVCRTSVGKKIARSAFQGPVRYTARFGNEGKQERRKTRKKVKKANFALAVRGCSARTKIE